MEKAATPTIIRIPLIKRRTSKRDSCQGITPSNQIAARTRIAVRALSSFPRRCQTAMTTTAAWRNRRHNETAVATARSQRGGRRVGSDDMRLGILAPPAGPALRKGRGSCNEPERSWIGRPLFLQIDWRPDGLCPRLTVRIVQPAALPCVGAGQELGTLATPLAAVGGGFRSRLRPQNEKSSTSLAEARAAL